MDIPLLRPPHRRSCFSSFPHIELDARLPLLTRTNPNRHLYRHRNRCPLCLPAFVCGSRWCVDTSYLRVKALLLSCDRPADRCQATLVGNQAVTMTYGPICDAQEPDAARTGSSVNAHVFAKSRLSAATHADLERIKGDFFPVSMSKHPLVGYRA